MASAAIYYHPEAYSIDGPKLMGRNVAGESFLRGFLLHSKKSEYWIQVQQQTHVQSFEATSKQLGKANPIKVVDKNNLGALSQPGVIYYPGPGIGEHAWHRAAYGHEAYSLCGITHTTSSAGAMDSIVALVSAPVQPWDAVICTSNAVKVHVEKLLQAQANYLVDRLGIQKLILPLLPVIPLGIHTKDFVFTPAQKKAARKTIDANQDTIVVLFMGRLSFHAKAHPLAMYQALEKAAQLNRTKKIVLVECGWFANDYIEKAYQSAAQLSCPSIRVVMLDGRDSSNRSTAWASADMFCSLSDNIQETFGIVPIEAMAAGIPVVVSDWDGYKDTVRHGIDGFRIPTIMPGPGLGGDLALRHALEIDTYDMYCGHACSLVSVDIEATAIAFNQLFSSADLRKKIGDAGMKRARELYDWAAIIPQYEKLWDQQNELRKAQSLTTKSMSHPWPARMDPFTAFSHYPSKTLNTDTKLTLNDDSVDSSIKRLNDYKALAMVNFAKHILPSEDECQIILNALNRTTVRAGDIIQSLPAQRQAFVFRALNWLLKIGILKEII